MSDNNFKTQRLNAIEQMREMNRRSQNGKTPQTAPPRPEKPPEKPPENKKPPSFLEGLGLPFLDRLKTDGDLTLILGILLLLLSEKADKRLLFALIYILL